MDEKDENGNSIYYTHSYASERDKEALRDAIKGAGYEGTIVDKDAAPYFYAYSAPKKRST